MRSILPNGQTAALAMAVAGAALVAVTTMFVPVSLLEGVARLSGLSDAIPAAGAALGDAARAAIAFATGAMTLAVLSYLLLRGEGTLVRPTANDVGMCDAAAQQDGEMAETLRGHMPWNEGVDDIRELGDLPTLRIGDVHPDAPARRLLVASQDLPPLELSEEYLVEPQPPHEAEQRVEAAPESAEAQPSIAEMVAQLEAAVAFRRQKLAELEAVAADLSADTTNGDEPSAASSKPVALVVTEYDAAVAEFCQMPGPVLEAVPSEAVQDDDIDSALAAALAALHRIHAGRR